MFETFVWFELITNNSEVTTSSKKLNNDMLGAFVRLSIIFGLSGMTIMTKLVLCFQRNYLSILNELVTKSVYR